MNETTQQRFRPLIEKRLAAIEQQLPRAEPGATISAGQPTTTDLRNEAVRLNHALRRMDGGFFGRCIRCGRDLPVQRLERELDAVTCDPCPTRASQAPRAARRRSSFA